MASTGTDCGDPKGSKPPSFQVQFQEFTSYITYFVGCLKETQAILKTLKEAFKSEDAGKTDVSSIFMTEKEEKQLEANLAKKSTILVVGQTNSGKSSLVNELLGGTYLPTAEVPCTSRIVRLKYSEHNYVQLLDKDGRKIGEAKPFTKKSIPRAEIALEDTKRSSEEWVNQVVEVGINNSLLQEGHLEFVDAPGMSENEALDNIVQECLDGVLQVIIYVIDGNSSLRTQERDFLYKLKTKMGHLPIFFVCNKVDRNQEAEDYDRDSDDEEEELEATVRRTIQEKTQLSYTSLVKNGLLCDDLEPEDCDVYHGVSTKEVRKGRREGATNQYTKEFEKMKSKLLKFAASSIKSHLRSAAEQLCQIQQRVFDLALSHGLKRDDPRNIEAILEELKSKEWKYNNKVRGYIRENETKIADLVSLEVDKATERIMMAAESMEFSPIKIGEAIGRNEVVRQCRNQIQTLVLMHVINIAQKKGKSTLMTITLNARTSLEKSFTEVSKESNKIGEIVKKQLVKYIQLNYRTPNAHLLRFDYSVMTSGYRYVEQAYNMIKDLTSIVTGTKINKEWKRKIAEDVINNINYGEVAKRALQILCSDFCEAHELFLVNVKLIKLLCDEVRKQSADQREVVVSKAPSFAKQMCKTDALLETLSSFRVQLGTEVGKGHRGLVYECSEVVAKQLYVNGVKTNSQYLAVQYAMRRTNEDCESILKPLSVRLDYQNRVTILLPKMDMNLYDALYVDPIKDAEPVKDANRVKGMGLSTRLAIVLQVIDACAFSRNCGLYHVDPRITNILLDERNVVKLNVCKTRDDNVSYPDDKAAFHVPQEKPADHASTETYLGHDLYSLGVLLWLLLNGKYCRPEYADTTKVEEVYSAVASGKSPDVSCLVDVKHCYAFQGLLQLAWGAWRKDMPDVSEFQGRLSTLHSLTDSETSENTSL